MPEPLLNVLKLCALALLYLFFLRVLRAVWAELREPAAVPTGGDGAVAAAPAAPAGARQARQSRGASTHLVALEPAAMKGRTFDLGQELTVGRAAGCQVALDDSYVSQLHARVFTKDGILYVEDLGSTNGTFLNGNKVGSPAPMKRGDQLRVGSTLLEVAG